MGVLNRSDYHWLARGVGRKGGVTGLVCNIRVLVNKKSYGLTSS